MLTFIRIVSVDGFQIALVEVLGGFWTGFDTWFGVFVKSVEIKVYISYFPLEQRQVWSWSEIDVVLHRDRPSRGPVDPVPFAGVVKSDPVPFLGSLADL